MFCNYLILYNDNQIIQASRSKYDLSLYHFRSASGQEVDFIIEKSDGRLVAVEVKATTKVTAADFNHIRAFEDDVGNKFLRGIVFYTGKEIIPFALPVDLLW